MRQLGRIIITSGLSGSISGKVLATSQDRIHVGQRTPIVSTLETLDTGLRNQASQIRVLTGTFHYTSPTGIPGDIHHRGERPSDTGSARLIRRDRRTFTHPLQIPRAGFRQRHRENRTIAVHDIITKQYGYLQTALGQSHLLHFTYAIYRIYIKQASYKTLFQQSLIIPRHNRAGHIPVTGVLGHLPHLFLQGHQREHRIYTAFNIFVAAEAFPATYSGLLAST